MHAYLGETRVREETITSKIRVLIFGNGGGGKYKGIEIMCCVVYANKLRILES